LHVSEKTKRRLEISITAVFVLALLLVGAVLIFSGGTASAKQIATLRLFGGQVEVQHAAGAFQTGVEGASLREGDTVQTGADGRASIEYFDGSLTRLDHDTTFTLVTLETLNNQAGSKVIEGVQGDGNSYNRVTELADAESRFEVETPTATASVQGTVYAVIVENGSTTIAVVDGVVEAGGDTGSVDVPAGKMVVVATDGGLGVVQDISQELLDSDWFSFNRCELDAESDCVEGGTVEPGKPDKEPREPDEDQTESLPPTFDTGTGGGPDTGGDGDGDGPPPPNNQAPHAGFTASPQLGAAPLQVDFTDSSSDPDGDQISSRHWSFGDGASQSGGLTPSHTYHDPGDYTVTLTVSDPDGEHDSKSRVINVGSAQDLFDHIVISPASATIQPGGSQSYTAEAFDTDGGSMGNVTANTSFSIAPNGSCNGNTCTATQPGAHTVTGTFSGDSDSATLTVQDEDEPPPPSCPTYALAFHTRPPTSQDSGHQFNVQVRVDVLEGGSSDGPLTIGLSLGGGSFSGGETSVTWTGQGTVNFNHLTIDQPGTYTLTASASCASPTDAAPITITESGGGPSGTTGAALGLVLAIPGLRWLRRRR
jgi:PKD repeat protein